MTEMPRDVRSAGNELVDRVVESLTEVLVSHLSLLNKPEINRLLVLGYHFLAVLHQLLLTPFQLANSQL